MLRTARGLSKTSKVEITQNTRSRPLPRAVLRLLPDSGMSPSLITTLCPQLRTGHGEPPRHAETRESEPGPAARRPGSSTALPGPPRDETRPDKRGRYSAALRGSAGEKGTDTAAVVIRGSLLSLSSLLPALPPFPSARSAAAGPAGIVPLPVAHLTGPGRGAAPRPARCPAASRPSLTCGPAHGSAGTPGRGRRVLVVPSPPSTRVAGNRFRLKVRAGGCKTEAEAAPGRARGPAAWAGQLRSRLTLPPRPFPAPGTARTGAGQERPRGWGPSSSLPLPHPTLPPLPLQRWAVAAAARDWQEAAVALRPRGEEEEGGEGGKKETGRPWGGSGAPLVHRRAALQPLRRPRMRGRGAVGAKWWGRRVRAVWEFGVR